MLPCDLHLPKDINESGVELDEEDVNDLLCRAMYLLNAVADRRLPQQLQKDVNEWLKDAQPAMMQYWMH